MNKHLFYRLLQIISTVTIHVQQMFSLEGNVFISNKADSKLLDYKTGFDKFSFKSISKLFPAKHSNDIKLIHYPKN